MTNQLSITKISKQVQKALLNQKIYKDNEFFDLDQKKILISVLKDKLNLSYAKLGKELNLTWFPVYKSCEIAKKKYGHILTQVIKTIKI
jgi:hypothetical protein